MDKKNTMLLTVIAVATLLVAVVGATFAYFSVSGGNSFSTVTGTAQTASIGGVTLTNQETALNIYVTAADMAEENADTAYYSTTAAIVAGTSTYNTSATNYNIALASVSGGETTTVYDCTVTFNVALSGGMASSLVAGDAQLVLTGMGVSGTYDLVTDFANSALTLNATVSLTGDGATSYLQGYLVLNNTTSNQDNLANKTLTVTITASDNWTCSTTA